MKKRTVAYPVRKTVRFTPPEIERLEDLLRKASDCQNLSELVREILFRKKLTVNTRDESKEQLWIELGLIRTEMNRIGVNINQITHFFHVQAEPAERAFFIRELLPHLESVTRLLRDLGSKIEKAGSPRV
ncbi:plasmid mobilization relaxosome protein MobC [Algoriphagus terrigena]|uniref:plasmid mobilization protein n=1 Tax=Algoriphagus terrigena TaxID=344884 RepID=UPI000684634B|nr:plasmid mobilization relaxosome protein MobC [Algoriphagus terrigena]